MEKKWRKISRLPWTCFPPSRALSHTSPQAVKPPCPSRCFPQRLVRQWQRPPKTAYATAPLKSSVGSEEPASEQASTKPRTSSLGTRRRGTRRPRPARGGGSRSRTKGAEARRDQGSPSGAQLRRPGAARPEKATPPPLPAQAAPQPSLMPAQEETVPKPSPARAARPDARWRQAAAPTGRMATDGGRASPLGREPAEPLRHEPCARALPPRPPPGPSSPDASDTGLPSDRLTSPMKGPRGHLPPGSDPAATTTSPPPRSCLGTLARPSQTWEGCVSLRHLGQQPQRPLRPRWGFWFLGSDVPGQGWLRLLAGPWGRRARTAAARACPWSGSGRLPTCGSWRPPMAACAQRRWGRAGCAFCAAPFGLLLKLGWKLVPGWGRPRRARGSSDAARSVPAARRSVRSDPAPVLRAGQRAGPFLGPREAATLSQQPSDFSQFSSNCPGSRSVILELCGHSQWDMDLFMCRVLGYKTLSRQNLF